MNGPMKNARDDMDWIEDFLEGSLNAEEETEFQSMLKADPAFARKYNQRLKLQETWQDSDNHIAVKKTVENIIRQEKYSIRYRRNILMLAASFIALVGLAGILLFVLPNKSIQEDKQADILADSIKKPDNSKGPQQIGIPRYGKSDTLSTRGINENVLLFPADQTEFTIGDSIHFQWKSNKETSELFIKDMLTDSLVFDFRLPSGQSEYFLDAGKLKPGSYVWFINEPITNSRFTVNKNGSKQK